MYMERLEDMIKSIGMISEDLSDIEEIVEWNNYKVTRDIIKRIMCLYDWVQDLEYRMTYLSNNITTEIEIPVRPARTVSSVIELKIDGVPSTQGEDT
jgi:hypothetical protein